MHLLNIVFCWDMRPGTPQKRASVETSTTMSYLRSVGDHTDLITGLERSIGAKAVLLLHHQQLRLIENYARQIMACVETGSPPQHDMLAAIYDLATSQYTSRSLINFCMSHLRPETVSRHPYCREILAQVKSPLHNVAEMADVPESSIYDLLVLFHLGWLAHSVHAHDPRLQTLMNHTSNFSYRDRLLLLQVIGEQLGSLVSRISSLSDDKRVELVLCHSGMSRGAVETPDWAIMDGSPDNPRTVATAPASSLLPRRDPGKGIIYFSPEPQLRSMLDRSYPDWRADHAVDNLVGRLERIADRGMRNPADVVLLLVESSLVWDSYPEAGLPFIQQLYMRLASHPRLRMVTCREYVEMWSRDPGRYAS